VPSDQHFCRPIPYLTRANRAHSCPQVSARIRWFGELVCPHVSRAKYASVMAFERISVDHRIMAGVPCIRGTRIPVATVVGMVAEGMSTKEILEDFPQLKEEDIAEALRYAAAAVDERTLPVTPSA
jgi:uncharacterized protein (DUF433 family)